MTGLVVVVPAGQAPVLQVTVPGDIAGPGEAVEVWGHTDTGVTWPVRGCPWTSDGSQRVLGDPLAPVNIPVWYHAHAAVSGRTVTSLGRVVRPWSGLSLMTDVIGGGQVSLIWQGDDDRTPDQRVTVHEVPGRATPITVFAPTMGAGTLSLTARTSGAHTRALASLAARPAVVALFHNPAHCLQCRRGACDVELVTVMALSSVAHSRTSRRDAAERVWTIKGTICSVPEPRRLIGTSVWDDVDAARFSWDRLDAMGLSWDAFDRTLWKEVRQ